MSLEVRGNGVPSQETVMRVRELMSAPAATVAPGDSRHHGSAERLKQRFGVARGLSPDDAYSRYALLYFRSSFPERTVWRPDPLDQKACLAEVRRDGETDWILRYSRRELPGARTALID
jgi:hypothetical protein